MKISAKNQALFVDDFQPIIEIRNNPLAFMDGLTPTAKKLFNYINWFCDQLGNAFPSQGYLAKLIGVERETVNRLIQKMAAWGIIKVIYNGYMNTCTYKVSSFFSLPHIRTRLSSLFSSFKYLSLTFLYGLFTTSRKPVQEQNVTLISYDNKNYNNLTKEQNLDSQLNYNIANGLTVIPQKGGSMKPTSRPVLKKRSVMEDFNFTNEEREELLALPKAALDYALAEYDRNSVTIQRPFKWLMKVGGSKAISLLEGSDKFIKEEPKKGNYKNNVHIKGSVKSGNHGAYKVYQPPVYKKLNLEEEKTKLEAIDKTDSRLKSKKAFEFLQIAQRKKTVPEYDVALDLQDLLEDIQ